ncbi:MAG: peptide MFS transporter [Bacteroidia bacterium]
MQRPATAKTILGHPVGLYVLFGTELWERFSYYGMRALLVLYLVSALEYPRAEALAIYGLYTGLVYLTPLLGGFLADKWLTYRGGILAGGILMALGHFAMAWEALLFPAMGLLILGNGFFKPNISTVVGTLYSAQDARRDGAFTIFYMGINVGAFLSPLVCGYLGESVGWHYGFAAAGVGMVISLLIFLGGLSTLKPFEGSLPPIPRKKVWTVVLLGLGVAFLAPFLWQKLDDEVKEGLFIILGIGLMVAIAAATFMPLKGAQEYKRVGGIFVLLLFTIIFWMGFEQAGGTFNLFAKEKTARTFLGTEVPASFFQSINPLLIVLLAPIFSWLWIFLNRWGGLYTPTKMALGLLLLGLGFWVMSQAQEASHHGLVSPLWLVTVYVLHTLGELCLSPVGLSMVTKVAPQKVAALMMGVWFLSSAAANYLAGRAEALFEYMNLPLFPTLMILGLVGAGVLFALRNFIARWIGER